MIAIPTRRPLLSAAAPAGTSTLLTGLVAYWSLDEASGSRLDASSNHYDMTSNNGVGQVAGKVGNAASFAKASAQYLSRADNADLRIGDRDFEMCGWTYVDTISGNMAIVSKAGGSDDFLLYNAGELRFLFVFYGAPGSPSRQTATLSASTWNFFDIYHDHTNKQIGVSANGGAFLTNTYAGTASTGTAPFQIGSWAYGTNFSFNGYIDAVGRWNRLLTTAERATLYNGGAGLEYPWR